MLSDALGDLCELNIAIADNFDLTISQMRSALRQLQTQQGQLGLVLIDYLQLMETQDNRVQGLGKLTRSLKKMAREFKVPIVVISQLSRAAENRTNKRPVMADLRESGSIEQDADVVAFVYRDEYYHPDTPDRGIAEIIFSKHRNGPTGTVKLLFDSQVTQFKNLAASNNFRDGVKQPYRKLHLVSGAKQEEEC
jgi:replicative DNA helicase